MRLANGVWICSIHSSKGLGLEARDRASYADLKTSKVLIFFFLVNAALAVSELRDPRQVIICDDEILLVFVCAPIEHCSTI